ncbi:tRNA (guanine(46)-N(7))-methyltransferase TrmB, partial [Rhizobiaceae sp. 2RAB30]
MTVERRSRSTEAFFGRRRGKTIRALPAAALETGLARLKLDLGAPAPARLEELFSAEVSAVRLEIGFGGGEHLMSEATRHPGTGFIGVEPFVNGMAKLMMALDERPLPNVRVYDDDATRLLDWLPDASLSGIDLLYPDPWPKKRHWKRRFVG